MYDKKHNTPINRRLIIYLSNKKSIVINYNSLSIFKLKLRL